jgi:hypothetical protein
MYQHDFIVNELRLCQCSDTSVKRRRRDLGLKGSGSTAKSMPTIEAEQHVLDEMSKDPALNHGVQTIQNGIAFHKGIHLPRDFVSQVMHTHQEEGFAKRDPTAKKIFRVKKVPIGIHERWSCDGHDKLYKIGFPLYAIVDDATSKWLGAWIVPSNRTGLIVGYLFLCVVEEYGGKWRYKHIFNLVNGGIGIPLQSTTDCGSETTVFYGLAMALRCVKTNHLT